MQTVWLKHLKLKCVISVSSNIIAIVFKQVSKTLPICHWSGKQKAPPQTQTIDCAQINKVINYSTYEWFTYSCPCILSYERRQYFITHILTHFSFKEKNNRTNKCLRCFKIALLSVKFIDKLFHILNIHTCKNQCNTSFMLSDENTTSDTLSAENTDIQILRKTKHQTSIQTFIEDQQLSIALYDAILKEWISWETWQIHYII